MDTIYYHLDARRVKVSGGNDLLTLVPAAASAPEKPMGEVLDFRRGCLRLETRAAWQELAAAAQLPDPAEEGSLPDARPGSRRERAGNWLELACSAAVLAVSLSAVWAFLGLL